MGVGVDSLYAESSSSRFSQGNRARYNKKQTAIGKHSGKVDISGYNFTCISEV